MSATNKRLDLRKVSDSVQNVLEQSGQSDFGISASAFLFLCDPRQVIAVRDRTLDKK